jgi:hypothetical protein
MMVMDTMMEKRTVLKRRMMLKALATKMSVVCDGEEAEGMFKGKLNNVQFN